MKKLMLVCGLMIGAATISFAQGGGYQMPAPADRAKALQTALKLTDDQTTKITAIYAATAAKRDSIMKAGGDRAATRPLRAAETEKVKALLTAEQTAAFDKMPQPGRGGQGGGGMGGGGGTPPPPVK